MWEAMQAEDDLEAVRRQLPEEFWADFDNIIAILQRQIAELVAAVKAEADTVADLSDKDVGLRLEYVSLPRYVGSSSPTARAAGICSQAARGIWCSEASALTETAWKVTCRPPR